jgi:hypothetical protein
MLLEEIILRFLHVSGYRIVETPGNDPTLSTCAAGIRVKGRGCAHQIDAIADYRLSPPFSNPQRLLVEGKSLNKRIGVEIVRNAVGVLRDVSEFVPRRTRYHYQYAIFSETGFSKGAQAYALAHDVYLLPLTDAAFFRPILTAVRQSVRQQGVTGFDLGNLRKSVRRALWAQSDATDQRLLQPFADVIQSAAAIDQGLIGMALDGLAIFLVPAPGVVVTELRNNIRVSIRWNNGGWYLETMSRTPLFSFDLPRVLFERYAKRGELTRRSALNLKEQALSEIHATVFSDQGARVVRFSLDPDWVQQARERLEQQRR